MAMVNRKMHTHTKRYRTQKMTVALFVIAQNLERSKFALKVEFIKKLSYGCIAE